MTVLIQSLRNIVLFLISCVTQNNDDLPSVTFKGVLCCCVLVLNTPVNSFSVMSGQCPVLLG